MQKNNPIINPVVVLRKEFDDWAVLFNPDTAEAVGINPIGVAIWELLAQNKDFPAIIETLNQQYSGVPDSVETEIDSFINDMAERGFLGFDIGNTGQ